MPDESLDGYDAEHIREQLISDPRINALDVQVSLRGDALVLTGNAATAERKQTIADVGDVHLGTDSAGTYAPHLENIGDRADLLLLAGDLTRHGDPAEAAVLADELADVPIPIACVLGNHDYHSDAEDVIRKVLEDA